VLVHQEVQEIQELVVQAVHQEIQELVVGGSKWIGKSDIQEVQEIQELLGFKWFIRQMD
jgi:hypothetical protein